MLNARRHGRSDGFALANLHARFGRWFTLVAIAAVFLQAFVVQTHIDGLAGLAPVAAVERIQPPSVKADLAPHEAQAACPICQALGTAGTILLAAGPSLISAHGVIAHEALLSIRHIAVRPAHAWRSRAPPTAL